MLVRMPEVNGKRLSPTQFLIQKVLKSKDDENMKDAVREALCNVFPKFECKTLGTPSTSEEVMANVSTSHDKLAPSFNQGVDNLITFLKKSVKPKQVFNAGACDGPTLAELVKKVADTVNNSDSIPPLENTWELVVESRCRTVRERLVKEYCNEIKARYDHTSKGQPLEEAPPVSNQESNISVMGIHRQLLTEMTTKLSTEVGQMLNSQVTGGCTLQSVTTQLEEQLVQYHKDNPHKVVGGALLPIVEENRERSRAFCNQLFNILYAPIRESVAAGKDGYTAESLTVHIKNLFQEYDAKSIGPERWQVRQEAERTIKQNQEIFEKHLEELSKRAQAQRQISETYEQLQNEMQTVLKHSRQMDESVRELKEQHQEAEERRREKNETELKELKEKILLLEQKMQDKEIAETSENKKEEKAKQKAASDQELQTMKERFNDKEIEETTDEEKEILDMIRQVKFLEKVRVLQEGEHMQAVQVDKEIKNLKRTLLQKKEEIDAEETVKYVRNLKEQKAEISNLNETIQFLKADHQLMKGMMEEKIAQEKKEKTYAQEEARIAQKSLDQFSEEIKTMKKKHEKELAEQEEKVKVLSNQLANRKQKPKRSQKVEFVAFFIAFFLVLIISFILSNLQNNVSE